MRDRYHSINTRLLLIPLVAVVALGLVGWMSSRVVQDVTATEHAARARVVAEAAAKIVAAFEAKAAAGQMPEAAAQEAAKEVLRAIRFDGGEYVIVRDRAGVILVNDLFRAREGKPSIDDKDINGTLFSRQMITQAEAGGGFTQYLWPKRPNTPPLRKASYSLLTGGWKWVVGSGVYLDDVEAAAWSNTLRTFGIAGTVALLTFGVALWLGRRITRPILALTGATHKLADGDLSVAIPGQERRDEIGTMAKAISVLRDRSAEAMRLAASQEQLKTAAAEERQAAMRSLADGFEASVKAVVDSMASSATQMEASANGMKAASATADGQTTAAAAAAEQTSANVETVASATEQLDASIQEIARQVAQSTEIASAAVTEADGAGATIARLVEAAQRVGAIIGLINGIASQTNLLALNATIEAARAGDAGKGFAVVATEVKSLAAQTAHATEEIQATVADICAITGVAAQAIGGIGRTVTRMNEIAAMVAAAVEEQGAATREIAGNIQQAAQGTRQVSGNVTAAHGAVAETGVIAGTVLSAAGLLSREADRLQSEVGGFLDSIRAA